MKLNRLIVTVASVLLSSSLWASSTEYAFDTNSLIGIEGGINTTNYEFGTTTTNETYSKTTEHVGLKVGAETRNYRLYFDANYHFDLGDRYDYIVMYGGAFQYKFNVADFMNIFLGVRGGVANFSFRSSTETFKRTISDPYVGGDIGMNFHLGDTIDLEFGGKIVSIQADNLKNGALYHVNEMVSGYTSIIFKWEMD